MGGPASPFLWNLAYDPIVSAVADGTHAPCPTYVDDLCGLAIGPALLVTAIHVIDILIHVILIIVARIVEHLLERHLWGRHGG